MMLRVYVLGGFLGAGKTTLLRRAARFLAERGEQVAVITNDQGRSLVDTSLCRSDGHRVREIVGGCFCCRYDELEAALFAAKNDGATVAIAEAVGSCTDLVATVFGPLEHRHGALFQLAPLAVVVDPWRALEVDQGRVHDDVAYLFRKQLEEADVVLMSRADLTPPDVTPVVRRIRPRAPMISVSGATGEGLATWLATRPAELAPPLDIDYDRYAHAEELLGWCNARVRVHGAPFAPVVVLRRFLERMSDTPIAHLKVTGPDATSGRGAIVRAGDPPFIDADGAAQALGEARWVVNARIALDPETLVARLKTALADAAAPALVEWSEVEAFRPSRPNPTHRYTERCGPGASPSCCP